MREKDENKDDKFTLDELKAIKEKVESTSVSLKVLKVKSEEGYCD